MLKLYVRSGGSLLFVFVVVVVVFGVVVLVVSCSSWFSWFVVVLAVLTCGACGAQNVDFVFQCSVLGVWLKHTIKIGFQPLGGG